MKKLRGASEGHPKKRSLKLARTRRVSLVTAGAVVTALLLSGCTPFLSLFSGGTETVFTGAPANTEFDSFETQTPDWVPCAANFECAEVFAPMNWNDESGERITLALVRQPALGDEPALGTLFINPGGPGASGVSYLMSSVSNAVSADVQQRYNIASWDPRGVGASSAVSCLTADEMDEYLYGAPPLDLPPVGSDEWIAEASESGREYGEACLERTGPLLGFVDTDSNVRDLDMMRAIVGDEQLHYFGYSYGTKIGARYAEAYPDRVGRMVLDGALDPTVTLTEMVRVQTLGFEHALTAYVTDCLGRPSCVFSGSPEDALTEINRQIRSLEVTPLTAPDGRTVSSNVMLTAVITALYSQSRWPNLDKLFTEIPQGETTTALQLADFYNGRQNGVYQSNMMEAFNAVNCLDYPRDPNLSADQMRAHAAELRKIAPTIGEFQGYGETFCAEWPVTPAEIREGQTGAEASSPTAPILVVGTTGDPATPYEWAVGLADQLANGTLITLHGEGHTGYGNHPCVTSAVDTYLLTGNAPTNDPHCARGQ